MVVKKRLIALALALMLCAGLGAQGVKVLSSVNKNVISMAEQLQLTLKIRSDHSLKLSAPPAPQVPGLIFRNVLSSSSSSTSIINGKISREHSRTFTYIFNPSRKGKFTIPGFTLNIGKREYRTRDIVIEVVDRPQSSTPQYSPDPFYSPFTQNYYGRSDREGDSRVVCLPENQSVYVGQPALIHYYLYTNQWVGSYNLESEKDYGGYGKSVYEQPTSLDYEDVSFNGKRYKRALLKSMVLYPQNTGRLQVPTLIGTMRLLDYSFLNRDVQSSPAYLNVKALPAGAPKAFTGAVGSFTVSQSVSQTQPSLGEAVTVTVKISGKGNFSQFTAPSWPAQNGFQISEPMVQDKLSTGIEGTRTIYYTLLPQQTGEFTLQSFQFSWFDTASQSYRSYRGPALKLKVKQANVLSYFSGILQPDKPKTLNPAVLKASYPQFRFYARQPWYWLAVALILLSLAVSGFVARERSLKRRDPAAWAQKSSARVLDKYLRKATDKAREMSGEFYPLAETGLMDYLGRNYGVSRGLSTAEALDALRRKGVPQDILRQLEDFFLLCQKARYMPGGLDATAIQDSLSRLRSLVQALIRFKNSQGGGWRGRKGNSSAEPNTREDSES